MLKINTHSLFPAVAVMLAAYPAIADEVVYLKSSEPCMVDAYPAPDAQPLPEKLNCGQPVTVLERRGPSMKVKLGEDKIIWVVVKDTTTDVPAEMEVQRLTEYQKKIESELDELNEQVKKLSETSAKLIDALMAAEAEKVGKGNNKREDAQ